MTSGSAPPAASLLPREEVINFYEEAFKQTMEDADYLAAASEFATDYKDAATTAALIDEQQAFTESLSTGFWYE